MLSKIFQDNSNFYFIGICGISMSSLAKMTTYLGKNVAGCDRDFQKPIAQNLRDQGIAVYSDKTITMLCEQDVVIYTDAINKQDVVLQEAKKLGKIVLSRGQYLFQISKYFHTVIGISGCHGKTTCTAMLSHVFLQADFPFACHIGGEDLTLSNFFINGKDYLITEACEYKRNMLLLHPDVAIVLDDSADHLDCYTTAEGVKLAYKAYLQCADYTIAKFGKLNSDRTFGYRKGDYTACHIKRKEGKYSFIVKYRGAKQGRITLSVLGKHQILNALACYAIARHFAISHEDIALGLKNFKGVKRRMEFLGEKDGVIWYADYAHHPDEIKVSYQAIKNNTKGKVYVLFQPHTYSRTQTLFVQFVKVLSQIKKLCIFKTYPARESYSKYGDAKYLQQHLKNAIYNEDWADCRSFYSQAKKGDVVLVLGAGDIYDFAKQEFVG